jgi:RecJ-like exonuclease
MLKAEKGLPRGLEDRLRRALEVLEGASKARILSHYDGDGTAAAALLTMTLLREGMDVHTTLSHHLDAEKVETLTGDGMDILLVSDMGSAQVDLLEKVGSPVVVLDHHQPLRDSDEVIQINPHFFRLSGTRDACGATTAFLLSPTSTVRTWTWRESPWSGASRTGSTWVASRGSTRFSSTRPWMKAC